MKGLKFKIANTVIAISLFITFIASVLLVVLLGIKSYHSVCDVSELTFNERTCLAYITDKLRHGDCEGAVRVGEFDGLNAIYIDSEYEGVLYNNIIYFYDGWLYEIYCEKDARFFKTDGSKIAEASSVVFSEPKSGLLLIEVTDTNGSKGKFHLYVRSEGRT